MKSPLILLTAVAVLFSLFSQDAAAEAPNTQVKVSIKLEKVEALDSPTVSTGTVEKRFKPKKWAYIEAEMKVQAVPVPKTGYLDNMTVTFYATAKSPEGPKGYLLMKKEIRYVNIPVNEKVYVCAFMSPSSVKRLTGSDVINPSSFERVGVEVSYNGKVVAMDPGSGRVAWWNSSSSLIVPTNSYPLLNKDETPFSIFWYDRYPEINNPKKAEASASALPGDDSDPVPAPVPAPGKKARPLR